MEIPRLQWDDPKVAAYFINSRPVVLTDCPLASPAADRWTGGYLNSIISRKFKNNVFVSDTLNFQYWDDSKNNGYNYKGKMSKAEMSFPDFINHLRQSSASNNSSSNSSKSNNSSNKKYYYLQQSVVVDMGQAMMDEYKKFSLEAALKFKVTGNWDGFSTNLLLVGPAGAVTPCHFDEQENLFSQLHGQKRVRLFPPEAWKRLYPYPLNHACDRQARVTLPISSQQKYLDGNQNERFPAFEKSSNDVSVSEYNTVLHAGEILYIPQFWFHQMEALTENTSLSWWFKHQSRTHNTQSGVLDLSLVSYVAVRRNLERMIGQSVGEGRQAHNLFLALAAGKLIIPMTDGKKFTAPGLDDSDYNNNNNNNGSKNNGSSSSGNSGKKNVTIPNGSSNAGAASTTTTQSARAIKNAPTASGGDDDDDVHDSSNGKTNNTSNSGVDAESKDESKNNNNNNTTTNVFSKSSNNVVAITSSSSSSSSSAVSLSSSSPSAVSASSASSVQAVILIKSGYIADYSSFYDFLSADVSDFEKQQIRLPMESDKLVSHAIEVASYVLGPTDAPVFLKELVSGRFAEL